MKRDQIPLVVLDGRHAGELLAHPCPCGHHRCKRLEHVLKRYKLVEIKDI